MRLESTERMKTGTSTGKWVRAILGINYIYFLIHKEKMDVNDNGRR